MELFRVGGCVRDKLLGVQSKDIDFTVVLSGNEDGWHETTDPFKVMVDELNARGFKIFLETPEFLTVRAQFPTGNHSAVLGGNPSPHRLTADFVLARKESDYTDGRRPDVVEPGTLMDDLARRDFTVNAMAEDSEGNLIDPFDGLNDLVFRRLIAVGNPLDTLSEDALRAVRALRFSVTKNLNISPTLRQAMESREVLMSIVNDISDERIQQELSKMFRFDTVTSLFVLSEFPLLTDAMFAGKVSLDATMKQKGRG